MTKELLGERYRLLSRIGEGGMAYVYLALDEKLGRRVAVKVLHSHMEKNPDIRKRFQLEAQAISSLDHPNIVKIYDFSGDQSEKLWIVTEVITGSNLADYLGHQVNMRLPMMIATCIVREILKALSKAHSQKIVHRDIKPENVMMTLDGRIKLMDFGIAKDMQHTGMTMTGTFMGSPSYMSPEQIRGKDVDFKSDIYSVSVLFYEILTGKLPFVGKTTHDVVLRIMEGAYTFPRFIVPNIIPEIDREIIKGMSMDPSLRHNSVEDYGQSLDVILKSAGFDESHIELERYSKSPGEYLKAVQLEKNPAETLKGPPKKDATTQRRRRKTDFKNPLSEESRKAKTSESEKTELLPHSRVYTPRPPQNPYMTHQTSESKKHEAGRPIPILEQSLPSKFRGLPDSPLKAATPDALSTKKTERSSHKDEMDLEKALGNKPNRPATPPQAISPAPSKFAHKQFPNEKYPLVRPQPPLFRKPPLRDNPPLRRPLLGTKRVVRQSFSAYFFGLVWVCLILSLSTWGFLELSRYLSNYNSKPQNTLLSEKKSRTTIRDKKTGIDSSADPSKSSKAPAVEQVASTKNPSDPTMGQKERKVEKGRDLAKDADSPSEMQKTRSGPKAAKTRVIRQTPSQVKDSVVIETGIIRQKKPRPTTLTKAQPSLRPPKSNKTVAESVSSPSGEKKNPPSFIQAPTQEVGETRPLPASEESPSLSPPGKAKIMISSQPAAEIFIDDMKVGNTNDSTTTSGWIMVAPGPHAIELRRQGYISHKVKIDIADNAQIVLPRIDLKPNESTTADSQDPNEKRQIFVLTIKVTKTPATVSIRDLETNFLQTHVLRAPSKTFNLESSRYQVRVEYQGTVRERTFNNLNSQGNYTFFAEF